MICSGNGYDCKIFEIEKLFSDKTSLRLRSSLQYPEVKLPLRNVALHAAHKVMDMDSRGVVPAREVRVDMATAATIQTNRHTQATTRGV